MATKAQQFRAEAQRTHAKVKAPVKARRAVDPSHSESRNVTRRGDRAASVAMEDSVSVDGSFARPTRKSTRKSAHHGRNDTALMSAAREKSLTPTARKNRR